VRRLWNRLLVFGTDRPFKILVTPVGDIQPDGTTEIRLQLFSSKYVDDLVDGTTGSLSPYGDLGDPLFASVDGHGDDFVTLDFNSPYTVTVTDGNTRSTIWNYTPPGGGDVTLSAVATQLTADQHADVLGVAFDQHDRAHVGVLDGARGTLRWQVQVS
jgi:hypothetical protein